MRYLLPVFVIAGLILVGCSGDAAPAEANAEPKKETSSPAPEGEPTKPVDAPVTEKTEEKPAEAASEKPFSNAIVTDTPKGSPTTTVKPDAERIIVMFTLKAKKGDKFGAALYIDETENKDFIGKVKEDTKDMPGDGEGEGDFAFIKPDAGWPAGKYRIDLTLNGKVEESLKFEVK
jgi:hypothetical protein